MVVKGVYRGYNINSVADAAAAAGYTNQSKFAAVFKKQFGVSPLEYRRKSRLE